MAVVNRKKPVSLNQGRLKRPAQKNQNLKKESESYKNHVEIDEELEEQFQDEEEDWDYDDEDSCWDDEDEDSSWDDELDEEKGICESDNQSCEEEIDRNRQTKTNTDMSNAICDIEFVPTNFASSVSKNKVPAMLSIINTKKSGRRISINVEKVLKPLGIQDEVQVSYNQMQKAIILGDNLGGTSYPLRKLQKKAVIYNAELIQRLTEILGLDFEHQSTISFSKVKIVAHKKAGQIAIITQQ